MIAVFLGALGLSATNGWSNPMPTLGKAALFSVLSMQKKVVLKGTTAGGRIGGEAVVLHGRVKVSEVVADPEGVTLGSGVVVSGSCTTGGAKIVLGKGASCNSEDSSGDGADVANLSGAINDLLTFESSLADATPTQTLASIKVSKDGQFTITDTATTGHNIISVPEIALQSGASLEISGGPTNRVILETGRFTMAPKAQIALTGGLRASSVVIYVTAKSVSLPGSAQIAGTLVAPNAKCALTSRAKISGAIICGRQISVGAANVQFTPFSPLGFWWPTGSLNIGRSSHTSTTLLDGRVLIVGGFSANNTQVEATAELYDPAGGTATFTGSMATGRAGHTATLLPSGKVLIAGGQDGLANSLSSAEIYDPAAGAFSPAASMNAARAYHTATFVPLAGKVIIAGGDSQPGTPLASTELYDPSTDTFTSWGTMTVPRDHF